MRLTHRWWSVLVAAVLSGLVGVPAVAAAGAQFLPCSACARGPRGLSRYRAPMAISPI